MQDLQQKQTSELFADLCDATEVIDDHADSFIDGLTPSERKEVSEAFDKREKLIVELDKRGELDEALEIVEQNR